MFITDNLELDCHNRAPFSVYYAMSQLSLVQLNLNQGDLCTRGVYRYKKQVVMVDF